jgi:predicted metal-binding membrane protein
MAARSVAVWRAEGRALRRELLRWPERRAVAVVLGAWLVLALLAYADGQRGPAGGHAVSVTQHVGMADASGMRGQPSLGMLAAGRAGLPGELIAWVLMTIAMMGPAALAGVRHTSRNSLPRRRGRAMAEYGAGYLAPWAIYGLALIWLAHAAGWTASWEATGLALAMAAGWQLTPWKRRCLLECHRSVPLPPRGWRAEVASARFGLRNGASCLGSCWPLMAVMTTLPAAHLWWTLGLTGFVTFERLGRHPNRARRLVAAGLCVTAAMAVVAAMP